MIPDKNILQDIGNDLLIAPEFPEKEYFVVQALKQIVENMELDGGELVFGGGTSLSTAYGLIKRFSEDIDLRFIPKPKSTAALRQKIIEQIKNMRGFTLKGEPISDSRKLQVKLEYQHYFPISKEAPQRPEIKIDIFFSEKLNFEPVIKSVSSVYSRFIKQAPETSIKRVALEETAVDKISVLLWRLGSDKYCKNDMRHLYDLSMLYTEITIDDKFRKIIREVFSQDLNNRLKSDKSFNQAMIDAITVLEDNRKAYEADYNKFVTSMAYVINKSFKEAFTSFKKLLEEL